MPKRRLQVLAEREHVTTRGTQVPHRRENLVLPFANQTGEYDELVGYMRKRRLL